MSVAVICVWALLGSGLIELGAFFLWRVFGWRGAVWGNVLVIGLPVLVIGGMALWSGASELVVASLWAIVAGYLACSGVNDLSGGVKVGQDDKFAWLLLAVVISACWLAAWSGAIGVCTGLALLCVGLVVFVKGSVLVQAKLCACIVMVTLVLGVLSLGWGGVHLTISLCQVVIPWVTVMAWVGLAACYLPKKATRWLGGLKVLLYLVMLYFLF